MIVRWRDSFQILLLIVSIVYQSDRELDGSMTDRLKKLKLIDLQKFTISCSV